MTLKTPEHVFQADLMNVPPLADAMGYGLIGSWVLNGLSFGYSGLNFTLQAGKAILQGRVFFLDTNESFTVPSTAGTYYLTLSMDLTKTNTQDSSNNITNNQFTLGIKSAGDMSWGSATNGDLQTDVALYKIVSDGSKITNVVQITYKYRDNISIKVNGANISTSVSSSAVVNFYREGNIVTLQQESGNVLGAFNATVEGEIMKAGTIPIQFIPYQNIFFPDFPQDYMAGRGKIDTTGKITLKASFNMANGYSNVMLATYVSQITNPQNL